MNICFFDLPVSSNELTEENDVVRAASLLAKELCKWGKHHVEFYNSKTVKPAPEQTAKEHFKQFLKDHQIDVAVWHWGYSQGLPFSLKNLPCKLVTVLHIVPTDSEQFRPDEIIKELNLQSCFAKKIAQCKPCNIPMWEFFDVNHSRSFFSHALQYSDKFVLLSEELKQALQTAVGTKMPQEKFCAIPDIVPFGPLRVSPIEGDGDKVSWRGKAVLPQKRPDFMLQIWQRIQELFPDWKLRFDGDVEYISKFKPLAKELGLKNVSFKDGNGEPEPYDGSATVFCWAYPPDGLSLLINKTIDLRRVHELQNISSEAINDRTFSLPDSPSEADLHAEKLSSFMNDISLCSYLASVAQKSSPPRFSAEEIADKWEKLLREVVGENL